MWIENISYILTFVISAGISAFGIMLAYQLYQRNREPVFATLMYQQIFLFSFLFYGIWGNIALRLITKDLNLNAVITSKLAIFVPLIGIPFLLVSWFMLLKFAYNLNDRKFSKAFLYGYFPTLVVLVFALAILIETEKISIPADADLFIVRIVLAINLLISLFFMLPFLRWEKKQQLIKTTGFTKTKALMFLASVIVYSAIMCFFNVFGFISACIGIVLMFALGTFIPVIIRFNGNNQPNDKNMDFEAFCNAYEISNREAEIIQEICSGKSNKAIAEKLFITLQTVKDHNHRIYTKTGVKSRVQLSNLVREKTGKSVSD
ncbi:helix-turn-helix transcriptional regulator [uncultured Draconibacterium sp.]|uniref:helix-turn-helix transcriptional regulator n=1 Tax=uncultured Draconibacterium sp. TaxID=1573823 RepID=UPI0032602372